MGCFTDIPVEIKYWVSLACAILGCCGSLSIIFAFLRFKEIRTYSNKLILNLAISQFLSSLTFFFPKEVLKFDFPCIALAIIYNSLQLISIFWAFSIIFILYNLIGKSLRRFKRNYVYWVLISWIGIPTVYVLPLLTSSYSSYDNKNWYSCSFKSDYVAQIWMFALFYMPAWIFIIVTAFLYCKLLKKSDNYHIEGDIKEFVVRSFYYPIVLVIILIPLSILRVYEKLEGSCVSQILLPVMEGVIAVQGVFDSIIFFGTPSINSCFKLRALKGRLSESMTITDISVELKD